MTGDRARQIRLNRGFDQVELARLCGLGESYISKIERGRVPVPVYLESMLRMMETSQTACSVARGLLQLYKEAAT